MAPRGIGRATRLGRPVSSLDPRDEAIIVHAARHLAGLRFSHPGRAPAAAARLIDEMRHRNLLKAERALYRS